jgi:hypothetical protein
MSLYYEIQSWHWLDKIWINFDLKKYSSLQAAKERVSSYKEHKLGVRFRILKIEIINNGS